jgi:hypothetical protein
MTPQFGGVSLEMLGPPGECGFEARDDRTMWQTLVVRDQTGAAALLMKSCVRESADLIVTSWLARGFNSMAPLAEAVEMRSRGCSRRFHSLKSDK